jgi:acyl-homoserine-lactone acylase
MNSIMCLKNYLYFWWVLGLVACSTTENASESSRWEAQANRVNIIRDDFGVPHIYGKSDADAVFGLLYAQCEDDFHRVERNYIWAIGRLAEVEGKQELYSDLRAHLFMTEAEAKEAYQSSPQWLKDLCDAFADGINYYLYVHPEVTPELLTHFEPWMPFYFSEGSIGGDIEQISTDKIRAFYEDGKSLVTTAPKQESSTPIFYEEPQGSNGIALSGQLTASGNAMLLINPHTSFYFRGEVHVVSEEGLNAYGAVTWGQFFVYQGFNEKTGWMHTSTYTDVMDEFVEQVSQDSSGYHYQYGEEIRPVSTQEVILKYKDGDRLVAKTFPIHRTHHGPITHMIGDQWTATAMMWHPAQALAQSYIRTKNQNHEEFNQMMAQQTNSSNNTVYADADGNIAYYHGNFIPKRDVRFDYKRPVAGSDPATDWKGLHAMAESITLLNPPNGWIQNCNSTPFTAAGAYSPKVQDYPYYMSVNEENYRGVHAIRLLEHASKIDLDKLIELAYDPYLPAFEVLIPGLVETYDRSDRDPLLQGPIEVLRNWDYAVAKESVAMSLAHFYGVACQNAGTPTEMKFMQMIAYWAENAPDIEKLALLKKAVARLIADFGTWDTPWGEINRYQRIDGAIQQAFDDQQPSIPIGMAPGNWGALAAYGARYHNNTKKIYGTRGNSFVAVVEFGEKLKAKSMLAGGQSGNPDSPHFDDQGLRYADRQFKEVAFYLEDVEARAQSSYHPGPK